MKKSTLLIIASVFFVLPGLRGAYAQDAEEKEIHESSVAIDRDSREPGEAKRVEARLEKKYNVTDARIDSLRHQGLGYGEISIVLSLAKQMPGGINDQNIQKIMSLRQGGEHKEGWGKVASDLGLKVRPAVKDTDDLRGSRHEEEIEERNERREHGEENREHNVDRHESNASANTQARSSMSVHGDVHMGGGHIR